MATDPADDWLRADAMRRGVSVSEYERQNGIMLEGGPAEKRARYHEIAAGLMSGPDIDLAARHDQRKLAHYPHRMRRPRSRQVRKAGRFASVA